MAIKVASGYLKGGEDPVDHIVKIAQEHRLDARAVDRLVKLANQRIVYGMQDMSRRGGVDPHFTVPLVKLSAVVDKLSSIDKRVPSSPMARVRVRRVEDDTDRVIRQEFGSLAEDTSEADDDYEQTEGAIAEMRRRASEVNLRRRLAQIERDLIAARTELGRMTYGLQQTCERSICDGTPPAVWMGMPSARQILLPILERLRRRRVKFAGVDPMDVEINTESETYKACAKHADLVLHIVELEATEAALGEQLAMQRDIERGWR